MIAELKAIALPNNIEECQHIAELCIECQRRTYGSGKNNLKYAVIYLMRVMISKPVLTQEKAHSSS